VIGWLSFARKLFLTGALVAGVADAQTSGGVFRGEVRDPSSAIVPQSKVVIRSNDNGVQVIAESNGDGLYVTPTLIPGSYTLSATKPGFETEVFGPVTLEVNQTVRVDFALNIGAASESVQVEASGTQLLSTESAEVSQVIVSKEVSEIPLNGRSWQQLIDLSAGVNPGAPGESGSPNPVNIDGQRTKANLYLVDGISTTSSAQGRGNDFNIPLEDVREFSVQAGSYSAEYGDVAGGVINLQSKSGTNNLHGSLFEFFRNDALDAADFFSNQTGQPKNALRYNQFGGSVGGPIRHNKTFFFADYQGNLIHSAQPMVTSVPVSGQRGGNFSALLGPGGSIIYDPFSSSFTRTPFPNNVIPSSLLDPAALKITSLLPLPNQFDASGNALPFNNYAVTRMDTSNLESFDIRLDHQFSTSNNLFVRESFQNTGAFAPSIFGPPLGGTIEGAGATRARNQNAGLGYTSTISPTIMNDVRIGLNRQTTALTQEDYGQNLSQQFGIPGVNVSPQTSGLSNLDVAGLFDIGDSLLTPLQLNTTDWNLTDKITWVKGRHVIHVGFDYQHEMGSTGYLVYGRGFDTFLNLSTSSLANVVAGTQAGNAFASFLVGAPYEILRDEFPPGMVGLISYRIGFFAQDDIKVTQKLTLNLGARYDIMPYPREMHDRLSNFDPATGTMLIAGQDTSQRLVNTDYKDLAPRVGLAYSPTSKTVIRAGYGIGFIDPYGAAGVLNSNEFNVPFYYVGNTIEFPFSAPTYTLSGAPPKLVMPSPNAPAGNQRYIVPTDGNQYSQTWSFTIQRALTPSLMFEVGYVGTSGNRLLTASDINAALPGATNPTTRQPYGPALGEIRELSNSAHSIYHGLQSKIEKRFSGGLYFLASYTWSKSIDNQSNGTDTAIASGQYPQDPLNTSLDRGLSSFDRPQVLVGSAVWEIPFGRGPAERSRVRELVNDLLGRWQLSGVLTAQSGTPFSVLMNCADINAEGNNCRPNRISSGSLPSGQQSINEWFNTSAFAIPSTPQYGNAGRNILFAPGLNDIDIAVSKWFPWGTVETRRLQIRSEFFNALNHTNLGVPQNSIDSPAFGTITSSLPGREIQFGARLEF
jgi:Carboxypeptidase regulatory-like domain/TonB-dependent Receptor Plug Domain/TonB dependent receptor